MEVTKVKFEGERTIVVFSQTLENDKTGKVEKEITFKTDSPRHQDFTKAAEELLPLALSVLKLPPEYKDGLRFCSVSLSYNDHQGMGAVCTMLKDLESINAPFVMNTPHLHNAEDGNSLMPSAYRNQIERLVREAELFVGGKRDDLFAAGAEKAVAA